MAFLDIFRPKWKHSDAAVRLKAVKTLAEQKALCSVATGDPDSAIRLEAVEKITDGRGRPRRRRRKAGGLRDQTRRRGRPRTDVRALRMLADESPLAEIARTTASASICEEAFGKLLRLDSQHLKEEELLEHAALTAGASSDAPLMVERIIEKLADSARVANVARHAAMTRARIAAL